MSDGAPKFSATDDDLPRELFEPAPVKPNRLEAARAEILTEAKALGLSVSPEELRLFAILLIAIRDDEEERRKA